MKSSSCFPFLSLIASWTPFTSSSPLIPSFYNHDYNSYPVLVGGCSKAQDGTTTYVYPACLTCGTTLIYSSLSSVAAQKPKHGLTPPALDESIHTRRCLAQLRSKDKSIEKYIYLSALKEQDPEMFYRLCLEHMSEFTPIIYTPTVGDACLQYSHIYRRPEGLVSFFTPFFSSNANFCI